MEFDNHEEVLQFLDKQTAVPTVQNSIGLDKYYQMAINLEKQIEAYSNDVDIESAFVVQKKFVKLYIYTISKHKMFNNSSFAKQRQELKKKAETYMTSLEKLKEKITAKYSQQEEETSEGDVEQKEEKTSEGESEQDKKQTSNSSVPNKQLPSQVATSSDTPSTAPSTASSTALSATASATSTSINATSSGSANTTNDTTPKNNNTSTSDSRMQPKIVAAAMAMPSGTTFSPQQQPYVTAQHPNAPPYMNNPYSSSAPPSYQQFQHLKQQSLSNVQKPPTSSGRGTTTSNKSGKPASTIYPKLHKPKKLLLNFVKKRTIMLPGSLMQQFLNIAEPNTTADIETCGVLCGQISNNKLNITHVLIPPQHGTSNTCVTCGEEKLIMAQDKYNLITLGWIHTHPTQDCFLSSIDMHTQYSYQLMMPEALAIVLAPSKVRNSGVFSLSEKGQEILSTCECQGFHKHSVDEGLYEVAQHVQMDYKLKCAFIDLR